MITSGAPGVTALRITPELSEAASRAWGFNCGPASVCAVAGLTPDEVRPRLGDFEARRYTNPMMMRRILGELGLRVREKFKAPPACTAPPDFDWTSLSVVPRALVRIQWGGPWCAAGVPVAARYRHSHWIATRPPSGPWDADVFDVNAGAWIEGPRWRLRLVPWLLSECEPKSDGAFWPTHVWEVT